MAAARRRVVYVVARNLIVLFVWTSQLVVVITFRRGGSGARGFVHPGRYASRGDKDASDGVAQRLCAPPKFPYLARIHLPVAAFNKAAKHAAAALPSSDACMKMTSGAAP